MSDIWIPWSNRNEEFAPVFALHKHEMFYPTTVTAFLEKSCELMVWIDADENGPIYGRINKFAQATMVEKIQWMLYPKINRRINYLDRHGGKIDMKKSKKLQQNYPPQLYVRGHRNQNTGEAYIIYWFFYVENYVPRSTNNAEIADILYNRPDTWWSHEGDWEAISIHFKDFEAGNPTEVLFSQHVTSESILWENIEKERGRIYAISALGSHATFNKHLRKRHHVFYAEVANPDILYYPKPISENDEQSYLLEELDPGHKHLWLRFKGRWGQSGGEFIKAPTGPLMKKKKHFQLLADI